MNYVNPVSIYGLMNKNCFIDSSSPELSFWKVKSKKKLVRARTELDSIPDGVEQVSYMYLDSKPESPSLTGVHSVGQIESLIDSSFLPGKITRQAHRDAFETMRKFSKKTTVVSSFRELASKRADILDMVEKWRYSESGGMKYGWVEHAGIDKACISRWFEDSAFRDSVKFRVFADSSSGSVLGYSMMSERIGRAEGGVAEASYLVRKCLVEGQRNLTEYVDWTTFVETMAENCLSEMVVNWGCSSGGVRWYKTHKWPVYKIEDKWFASWKKKEKEEESCGGED